jgi:hypothetical protein
MKYILYLFYYFQTYLYVGLMYQKCVCINITCKINNGYDYIDFL